MTERLHFHFSLSCFGERNGNPLQYSCLENPRDGGAWWAAVYGVSHRVGHDWSDLAAAAEEPDIKLPTSVGSSKKAREFQKNIYFCFIDYTKVFDCLDHNKLWKILQEMGIPDHLTCLLRNLYAGQEATVKLGMEQTDWFQIGNGVRQGCMLSPCLFNLYAEYIMRNTGLEEAQAGIKIARRNINNLRYADDTTLMEESEEELKSLLIKWKRRVKKVGLKINIQKTKSWLLVSSLYGK